MVDDKSAMTIGADGQGMHSLSGSRAATVTCRFLKTSPVNDLIRGDRFNICDLNDLCDMHNIKLSTERRNFYRVLHCKRYGDMTHETKEYLMACILDDMRSIIIPNHITE